MERKLNIFIILLITSLLVTSCGSKKAEEGKVEELENVSEELSLEDILRRTLDKKYEEENYRLEYVSEYHFELDNYDDEIGSINIDERDIVYHYQDGNGKFKTVLKKEDRNDRSKKIVTYDKDLYIYYDSQEGKEEDSLLSTWRKIKERNNKIDIPGFFITESTKEFMDFIDNEAGDYPRNPLEDSVDLLDIYNHSDIYKLRRSIESENDSIYVINVLSEEEDLDVEFHIDRKDFHIRSYSGYNGDAIFSGRVLEMEKDVDYSKDFFSLPNII